MKMRLSEDKIGVFQPQSAIPALVPLTEEQYALAKSLNKDNSVMKIENLKFEDCLVKAVMVDKK